MANTMDEIRDRHQDLLALIEEADEHDTIPEVEEFLEQLSDAGTEVANTRQRSYLRGLIRFWGSYVYDQTGQFPEVRLLPASEVVTSVANLEQDDEMSPPSTKTPESAILQLTRKLDDLTRELGDSVDPEESVIALKEIGPYDVIDEIGEGGFSKVYRAVDTSNERVVALKVLQGEEFLRSRRFQERLIEREQLVAELEHPNIIPVYSVAEYDGLPCIAMKLVEGGSLADRITQAYWRPSVRQILGIVHEAAKGLSYLHDEQIIHRDIKPANLLLSFNDQEVYLTDFGIAQVIESAFKGMIVGTPEYLAPEAILHPDSVDERADIYSLGIILFELFIGRPPFRAQSVREVLHLQVNEPVPEKIGAPTEIVEIIHRCLKKDPAKRFQKAQELTGAIEQALSSMRDTDLEVRFEHFTTSPEERFKSHDTTRFPALQTQPRSRTKGRISCPQCGNENPDSAGFCDNCGAALVGAAPAQRAAPAQPTPRAGRATCPSCGSSVVPGEAFCDNCGADLSSVKPASQTPSTVEQPPQPSSLQDTQPLSESHSPIQQGVLAILIVRSGFSSQDHFVIRKSRTAIGRGAYNDLVINERGVSRQHALLIYEAFEDKRSTFTLFDLASTNGTFVNTQRSRPKYRLKHNDVVKLGKVELLFKRLDDDPKSTLGGDSDTEAEDVDGLEEKPTKTD